MPFATRSLLLHQLSTLTKAYRANTLAVLLSVFAYFLLANVGLVHAQESTLHAKSDEHIIVKIKQSLAQEAESQLFSTTEPPEGHIRAGRTGNPILESFLRRHGARQLTPFYPQLIRIEKQHKWSDAQLAQHIRQRFANRARRVAHYTATPEISRTYVLEFASMSAQDKLALLQRLKSDPDVEFAEPEHTYSAKLQPNDPFLSTSGTWGQSYADLWGLFAIGAPAAWDIAQGEGVVVGVVDTGVDYKHPDLAGNVWTNTNEVAGNFVDDDGNGFVDDVRGWNFVDYNNDPIDHNGHGTHVAGIIAAQGDNGIGIIGVAWHSRIMAIKGLDDNGFGFDSSLASAIVYAANNGADVINASWGAEGTSQSLEEAIQFATGLGTVFVAAAGNSSEDAINFSPANSPEAITVASTDPFGNFSYFSNFGSKIDVTAPGEDILSLQAAGTFLGPQVIDGYIRLSGTSMAAPQVSGVAALALSENPAYSAEQIRQVLRSSATSIGLDSRFGYGKLNAAAATAVTNPLEARITRLQFGAGPLDPITISGFADGLGFTSYTLEYGIGSQPQFWTPFFTSITPASGTLGVLDPSNLFDGTYTIRLTAFNSSGTGFVDQTQFTLTLLKITSPLPGNAPTSVTTYKPGFLLPITGTATIPGFQSFVVEWARGQNATTGWQNSGITLAGNGFTPVANSQLATWDTSSITQAGYYTLRLTLNGTGVSEQTTTGIYLEPDLLSIGWPVFVDQGPFFSSGILPALNADGSSRLVMESPNVGDILAASWIFNLDGSFQKTSLNLFGSFHQPAVGNVDGIAGDEAVMPDFNVVRVIHPNTTFDVFTPDMDVDLTINPLLLEDLNNDFQLETIAVGSNYNTNTAYVFAWRPDGQQASGFPIQVLDENNLKSWRNHARILVADIDGDGKKDVLVQEGLTPTTYVLRLFANDGTPKTWSAPVLTGLPFAMAAADLDHNGKLETILVAYNGPQAMLHVLQPDGTERPGWPVDVSNNNQFAQAFLAVGDFNRDGHEEVVFSHETEMYVFNSDGTLFSSAWPLRTGILGFGAVVIADVDGDGFPEIVTTRDDFSGFYDAKVLVIRGDGTLEKSWQLTGSHGLDQYAYPAPAVGDFNQDGTTDIAIAYEVTGQNVGIPGVVTILDTHASFDASKNDWPVMFQNGRDNPVLLRVSGSSLAIGLASGANPSFIGDAVVFTAVLTPGSGNGAVQFLDGTTPISGSIPLTNGAASFSTSALALGNHSITARYTGDNKFSSSVSPALVQTVVRGNASVSVSLAAGTNPAATGDSLKFAANVTPGSATGSVIFFDDDMPISGDVLLTGGTATFVTSSLSVGTHAITAHYSGDSMFNGAMSPALSQTVKTPKVDSSVSLLLKSGTNPSVYGDPLTLTANISPISATGTVMFFDGSVAISDNVPLSSGAATFIIPALGAGTHSITAHYSGDANLNPSTSAALVQNVIKANTTLVLAVAESDSFKLGAPVTFVVTISPADITGTVLFYDGTTRISDQVTLSNGRTTFTTTTLSVGTHSITALYGGNENFNGSVSNSLKVKVK